MDRRATAAFVLVLALALAAPAAAAAKPKPSLSVTEISDPPRAAGPGSEFTVRGEVKNSGNREAEARVEVSLRKHKHGPVAAELFTDRVKVEPKRSARFSGVAEIPKDAGLPGADLRPGEYELVACVKKWGDHGGRKCKAAKRAVKIPAFKPGARSAGDPIFPQIGNGGYDARHYRIKLDYDPAANVFNRATTTIKMRATRNLSEFTLDFQDQLEVSEVLVDGEPAGFSFAGPSEPLGDPAAGVTQPTKLVVEPASGIRKGERVKVRVSYSGEPVRVIDADLSSEGWIPACYTNNAPPPGDPVCDGAFVVNEPIGAQGWFPSNNHPTDKASFKTIVTVPETHVGLGIGELVSDAANGDGTRTWVWSEDDPSATYLATATVGLFDEVRTSMTETVTGRTLPIYNYIDASATADQVTAIRASTDRQPAIVNFLGSQVFDRPYPFDSTGTVADKAIGVGYALEVQTKPHFAGSFSSGTPSVNVGTLAHELAHQWMGDSVSPATWREIWFNEGWATWLTWYWAFLENGGPDPADLFTELYEETPAEEWERPPALISDPADLFLEFQTYDRGAMTLEAYRQIVGDEIFFEFAGDLVEEFRHGNISTRRFTDEALAASGFRGARLQLLREFFDQWLFGTTRPTILPGDFA